MNKLYKKQLDVSISALFQVQNFICEEFGIEGREKKIIIDRRHSQWTVGSDYKIYLKGDLAVKAVEEGDILILSIVSLKNANAKCSVCEKVIPIGDLDLSSSNCPVVLSSSKHTCFLCSIQKVSGINI